MLLIRADHIQQIRSIVVEHRLECSREFFLAANLGGPNPKTLRNLHKIGIGLLVVTTRAGTDRLGMINRTQIRMGTISFEEPVFPLHHHPQVLIVQEQRLHRQVFTLECGEFLYVHQHAAVTINVNHQRFGMSRLNPHGCGKPEAHGAKTGTAQPATGAIKLIELSGPHLMLSDADRDVGVKMFRLSPQFLDRILRNNEIAAVFDSQWILLLPCIDGLPPRVNLGDILIGDHRIQSLQDFFDVRHDTDVGNLVLIQFRRINIDVNDLAMLGKLAQFSRHAIVKPHAKREQQVGLINRIIRIDGAVHPEHVQRLVIIARKTADPHDRGGHRDIRLPSKFGEFFTGIRLNDAATRVENRLLRLANHLEDRTNLIGMDATNFRVIARQIHFRIIINIARHQIQLDILRNIDQHWAGSSRSCNVKRLFDDPGNIFGLRHQIVMLGDGPTNFDHRGFLKRITPNQVSGDLCRDRDQRNAVHLRIGDRGYQIRRSRTTGPHADPHEIRRAGNPLRCKGTTLLVSRKNRADFGAAMRQ